MRFFDLVAMQSDDLGLAGRLGYKAIYSLGKDVEIIDSLNFADGKKKIVRSDNSEVVTKALRQREVIGMLPGNYSVSKKLLETLKNEEKIFFVPISQVVCAEGERRISLLSRARSMIRSALRAKVNIALVSLAEEREGLLSSAQMLELAGFLGIEQSRAKPMLSVLGGSL